MVCGIFKSRYEYSTVFMCKVIHRFRTSQFHTRFARMGAPRRANKTLYRDAEADAGAEDGLEGSGAFEAEADRDRLLDREGLPFLEVAVAALGGVVSSRGSNRGRRRLTAQYRVSS